VVVGVAAARLRCWSMIAFCPVPSFFGPEGLDTEGIRGRWSGSRLVRPVSGRGPPWGGMTRTDRGAGAAEVPDPGRGKARGRRTLRAAQRRGCWVRRSRSIGVKGAPGAAGSSRGAEADRRSRGHRGGWGCHGRDVLDRHSMRWPRPADRDGARRLRVCVADVPVVLGPAAGQATFAPGAGAAAAGWRARVGPGGLGWARWRSRCHPTTPARRHMKYEGFVKKCRHVRLFGAMAP